MITISDATRSRMIATGVAATAALFIWLNLKHPTAPLESRVWCGVILALALWPLVRWAKKGGDGFPCFEALCASLIPTEALPLLTKHDELLFFGEETIRLAALAVIAFQLSVMLGFFIVRAQPLPAARFLTSAISSRDIPGILSALMTISSAYVFAVTFLYQPPSGLVGPLRAIFSGLAIVSAYSLANYSSQQALSRSLTVLFILNLVIAGISYASTLVLAPLVSLLLVTLLGYCANAHRIPWVALALTTAIIAFFHNGKSDMRQKYWVEESHRRPTVQELPAFYMEWINASLNPSDADARAEKISATRKFLERISLLHMLAMVIEYTPSRQPHLAGETYTDIPAQLVPRLFWPGKPRVHVSTHRLSIYYGLQDELATESTTISFGYRAEAWANFGLYGMLAIGLFFGALTKLAWSKTREALTFSPAGIMMVAFTAWCVDGGQTLSVWISSLSQALIVLLLVAIVVKNLLRD